MENRRITEVITETRSRKEIQFTAEDAEDAEKDIKYLSLRVLCALCGKIHSINLCVLVALCEETEGLSFPACLGYGLLKPQKDSPGNTNDTKN